MATEEIINARDQPELVSECIRLASRNPQRNLLLLADLYPPHSTLSDICIMVRNGRVIDLSIVYRGFRKPSVVLGTNRSTRKKLLRSILPKLEQDFMSVCDLSELHLFKGLARIVDAHTEHQMILGKLVKQQRQADVNVRLVEKSELDKLDGFMRMNGALAWLTEQFEAGPYCCVEIKDEIVSVAGVHFVTPQIAQLGNIVTAESHRNRGYASACIYRLASMLQSSDRLVSLFVAEGNAPAMRIYKKLGFREVRRVAFIDFTILESPQRANSC